MATGLRWTVGVALLAGLFAWLFLVSPLVEFGLPVALAGLLVAGVILAAIVRLRRESDTAGSNVWDAIPSWQYTGRHVESGGLARDEQERALDDLQQEAARRRGEE